MATDKRISELPVLGTPTRADILTALGDGGINVQAPASDYLGLVNDTDIGFTDNTTGDASTGAHGFMPKIPTGAVVGMLLGLTSYNPALTDVATTSTAGEDLDATNLTVTFRVPASGRVLVGLSATVFSSTAGVAVMFLLRTTGGVNVAGTKRQVTAASATTGQQLPVHHRFLLSGLTPDALVTYRWGVMLTGAGTGHIRYGDDGAATGQEYGPAVIEVWAA